MWFYRHPQRVFRLVVGKAAPRRVGFGKSDDPVALARNHMQTVFSRGERLAFHGHRIGKFDESIFIRPAAPGLPVGHDAAPPLAPCGEWTMVGHVYLGSADALT